MLSMLKLIHVRKEDLGVFLLFMEAFISKWTPPIFTILVIIYKSTPLLAANVMSSVFNVLSNTLR